MSIRPTAISSPRWRGLYSAGYGVARGSLLGNPLLSYCAMIDGRTSGGGAICVQQVYPQP
jgi:hypothetical protein